jgi:hypothetical protein
MPGGTNLTPSPDHPPGVAGHNPIYATCQLDLGRDLE